MIGSWHQNVVCSSACPWHCALCNAHAESVYGASSDSFTIMCRLATKGKNSPVPKAEIIQFEAVNTIMLTTAIPDNGL